ncbi:MAG: hypothetical protein FJX72_03190 [Armatimonadetes bacterium]|nr:hypothetical protein [Armatimonadota bacterium]
MLRRSQTKVIFPIIAFGLLREHVRSGVAEFHDTEIARHYGEAVEHMQKHLGHDLHTGGRYYDAYPSRDLPKYGVLRVLGDRRYRLTPEFARCAAALVAWMPERIRQHIDERLGAIPSLADAAVRMSVSTTSEGFLDILTAHIIRNPTNFEVFSFAVLKVHLEKFACRIYRDTRTSASDSGVDLSTNFGVVFQIKKLRVLRRSAAEAIHAELRANFDNQRLSDGNVVLIIDDIAKDVKQYLANMRVQSITRADIIDLARGLTDPEDRAKVLRIVHEEFRREYAGTTGRRA